MRCENCERGIWKRLAITCACGKHFCCKRCCDEWHEENLVDNENEIEIQN